MRVLIVDDGKSIVEVAKNKLAEAGYEIQIAANENQALNILRENPCRLVVSNLVTPQIDSLKLCRHIRSEKQFAGVYIILRNENDSPQRRIEAFAAGADDFISNSDDLEELVAHLRDGQRALEMELTELQAEIRRRRHAEESLKVHTRQEAIVAQFGERALGGTEPSILIDEAMKQIAEALDVEYTHMMELQPDGTALTMRGGAGWKQGYVGTATVNAHAGTYAEQAIATHAPVVIKDGQSEKRFDLTPLLREHRVVSGASIAIHCRKNPFGVIGAFSTRHRDFTPQDLYFLEAIGNVLVSAIDRQRSLAMVYESEQHFRQIAENITEVFWVSSADGNEMHYVSPTYAEIWGRPVEEIIQKPWSWMESIHHEDRERVRADFTEKLKTGEFNCEYRVIRPDGTIRWIWDRGFPIRNSSGETYRVAGIAEDITKRRHLEDEQRRSQLELADFLENATEGLRWVDADGMILWANQAELNMLGYTYEEYVGHRIAGFHADPKASENMMARLKNHEEVHEYPAVLRHKNGSFRHVLIDANVLWQDGKFVYTRSFTHDITERKWAEEELAAHQEELVRANNDLARSNQQLSELYQTAQRFVDNVSHEFRTPLTVIKGYVEAISQGLAGPVNERQQEFLAFVADRTRDLAQMVDDLLDSSKLRAGTLRIDRKARNIEQVLSPIRPMLRAKAASNKVKLIEELHSDLPDVFADAEKAGRVLVNLVVNAIKFSPEGGRVVLWARPEADGGVEIGVTDHGPGIAPDNLRLIFERFKQVGNPQNSITKGFGLGLNIARELVALNLGDIRVSSDAGDGSTFAFTLPPNQPRIILQRYFSYLTLLQNIDDTIGAIRVTHWSGETVGEGLRGLISAAVRPSDLVLESRDGDALVIIGCTSHTDKWVDQLQQTVLSFGDMANLPHVSGSIRMEHVGAWPYPAGNEQVIAKVMEELHREVVHA